MGGQLGDGTTTDRWSPTLVFGGLSWKQIEVGGNGAYSGFTCGLTTGEGSTAGVATTLASWATARRSPIPRYPRRPPTLGSRTGSSPQEEATAARSVRQTWRTAGDTPHTDKRVTVGSSTSRRRSRADSRSVKSRPARITPAVPPPATRPTAGGTVTMGHWERNHYRSLCSPGRIRNPQLHPGICEWRSHLRPDNRAESLLLGHELHRATWQWDHNQSARPRRGADWRPVCSAWISGRPHVRRAGRHGGGLLLGGTTSLARSATPRPPHPA